MSDYPEHDTIQTGDLRGVTTVTDSDATLTGLPSGKTVKVRVTVANDADESAPSAALQAVVA